MANRYTTHPWRSKLFTGAGRILYKLHSDYAIPTQLAVCLTDKCNLRCKFCMRETFQPPKGEWIWEDLETLLEKMPYIKGVCIMGLCEPLLHPDAGRFVALLAGHGYGVAITTNGMVNTAPHLPALLCANTITFSIDTADRPTLNYLRGGAELDRILLNMDQVLWAKDHLGRRKLDPPLVYVNAVMTSHNFTQFPGLVQLLNTSYADRLAYLMVDPVTRTDYQNFEAPFTTNRERYLPLLAEYREIARNSKLPIIGLDWMFEPSTGWKQCPLPYDSMFLQPNGDVFSCYHYALVFGNVYQEGPLRIWNNKLARHFRRELRTGHIPLKQCETCNFARKGWQPGGVYLKEKRDVL